jgi:predicted phosphodiesterase
MMDPVLLMLMVNQSVLVMVNGQDVIVQVSISFIEYILKSSICMTLIYGHVHSDGFPKIKAVFILT